MVQSVLLWQSVPAPDPAAIGPIGPIGRRGAARLRLAIPARVVLICATESCVLLDLSCTGARIGLAEPLATGTPLYLKVAQLEVFAEVLRCHRGAAGGVNGLRFDEPLSGAEVLAVRTHADTYLGRERAALREQVRRWVSGDERF